MQLQAQNSALQGVGGVCFRRPLQAAAKLSVLKIQSGGGGGGGGEVRFRVSGFAQHLALEPSRLISSDARFEGIEMQSMCLGIAGVLGECLRCGGYIIRECLDKVLWQFFKK